MILAGDVGGTKTLLGVFERSERRPEARPEAIDVRAFPTLDFPSLSAMIAEFLRTRERTSVEAACFGVAGPVLEGRAELTNVPWIVDAADVARTFSLARVALLNDLQSMAYAVPVLDGDELVPLQPGTPLPDANVGLIAAGTGLGQALLHHVAGRGLIPSPSEGGHADFSARTPREIELLHVLTTWYGRADVEHVVSGRGLTNLHRFVHTGTRCEAIAADVDPRDIPARLTTAALDKRCAGCVEALDLFVEAYGAEAGNLALRGVTAGGVFVGGGIAPKILPALTSGTFVRAFGAKPPMDDWLKKVPVSVILNPQAALLGAAVFAAQTHS